VISQRNCLSPRSQRRKWITSNVREAIRHPHPTSRSAHAVSQAVSGPMIPSSARQKSCRARSPTFRSWCLVLFGNRDTLPMDSTLCVCRLTSPDCNFDRFVFPHSLPCVHLTLGFMMPLNRSIDRAPLSAAKRPFRRCTKRIPRFG